MRKLFCLLAIAAGSCGQPLFAQQQGTTGTDTATFNFVQKAAKGGMMEVASGKLAQAKGQSSDVKNFGSRMIKDHSQANAKLMKIAAAKSISMPPAPPDDTMLTNASGADFDRDYVQMMVKDHEEDVAEFQKAASSLPDADVRNFAKQTLPILQDHLKMIKAMAAKE